MTNDDMRPLVGCAWMLVIWGAVLLVVWLLLRWF